MKSLGVAGVAAKTMPHTRRKNLRAGHHPFGENRRPRRGVGFSIYLVHAFFLATVATSPIAIYNVLLLFWLKAKNRCSRGVAVSVKWLHLHPQNGKTGQ